MVNGNAIYLPGRLAGAVLSPPISSHTASRCLLQLQWRNTTFLLGVSTRIPNIKISLGHVGYILSQTIQNIPCKFFKIHPPFSSAVVQTDKLQKLNRPSGRLPGDHVSYCLFLPVGLLQDPARASPVHVQVCVHMCACVHVCAWVRMGVHVGSSSVSEQV